MRERRSGTHRGREVRLRTDGKGSDRAECGTGVSRRIAGQCVLRGDRELPGALRGLRDGGRNRESDTDLRRAGRPGG